MRATPFRITFSAALLIAAVISFQLMLSGCTDQCTETYSFTYYEPVFTPLSEIRNSVSVGIPQPLEEVGKIYFKDGYLFVNDPGKGIHVIDNQDPSNPVKKYFINIPGNYDLSIRNTILYADSYIDLVALDISDLNQVKEVGRLENIFSGYNSMGFYADSERGIVTEWVERKDVQVDRSSCEGIMETWGGIYYRGGIALMDGAAFSSKAAISPGNTTGVGGSMARFTINNDHLYMLDAGSIHTVDIGIPASPEKKSSQYFRWDIETIFPYEDKLFIGAQSGMHIFDLSDPDNPTFASTYEHINSCDPVVVDNDIAYVTLRSGNECNGFTNQLEVLDVEDWMAPELIKIYPMHNPHGLGIDNELLFLCDGDDGLKIYNVADKQSIDQHLIKHYHTIHAYDVIPINGVLMLIGEDGIVQYDYSDPENITKISHLKIQSGS
jgi:hypothetical protein